MREENFCQENDWKGPIFKKSNIFELLFLRSNKLNWACGGNCLHSRGVFGLRRVISDICLWARHKRGAIVSWVSWNLRTSMSWFIRLQKSRIMRQKMTQNRSEWAEKCQSSPHCHRHASSHYLLSAVSHKVVLTHPARPFPLRRA